jgi:hypothetical protein
MANYNPKIDLMRHQVVVNGPCVVAGMVHLEC